MIKEIPHWSQFKFVSFYFELPTNQQFVVLENKNGTVIPEVFLVSVYKIKWHKKDSPSYHWNCPSYATNNTNNF
jgi:hypothetical protein